MRPIRPFALLLPLLLSGGVATAMGPYMPAPIDVGDLTSDGAGGWNYLVRPLAEGETAPDTIQFIASPNETINPPATPAQSSIFLLAGQPLTLVIPNSGPYVPMALDVFGTRSGDDINISISRTYGIETDAPFDVLGYEYLHPLGTLAAGDYSMNLSFVNSSITNSDPPLVSVGHLTFTVAAIPTPATLGVLFPGIAGGLVARRWKRRRV